MRRALCVALGAVLMGGGPSARADVVSCGIEDVSTIRDGEGSARILFRLDDLDLPESVHIAQAYLRIPLSATTLEETFEVRAHPVTSSWTAGAVDWSTSWSRPGGDFDETLYGRASVGPGRESANLLINLTSILKEDTESRGAGGILLTVSPYHGDGIRSADLACFSSLSQATVEVRYRERRSDGPPRARRR